MKYEGIVYRPPSEARSLILQITIGCAHNKCTFCTMYKGKQFRIRDINEIKEDIENAHLRYGDNIKKIFLADGDALVIKTEMMLEIIDALNNKFPSNERITSYGAPKDILNKTTNELKQLKEAGLYMVYVGLESGDDEILKNINKGVTSKEIIEACNMLKKSGIKSSVTLISGLGGRARLNEHALESAKAVSLMNPDYVGFLTLMLEPGSEIKKEIEAGNFELLNPHETALEMKLFLENLDSEGTVFRANHASNYLTLKGTLNKDIPDMLEKIKMVDESGDFKDEAFRAL